jgi:short-subunit dehydrogenase
MNNETPPHQRVMIVTGASSGIGRALAILAAANGFAVVGVARRAERLAELRDAIVNTGGSCATLAADITVPETPRRIIETAMQAFGRIDVVVNNAGAGAFGPLLEQTEAATENQWQLHVAGPLRLARAAFAQLVKNRGQLLFLGSGLARVPLPSYGAYASAKAAARAAAIQLRRELRGFGVAVTYVDPGLVDTEFHIAMGSKVSSNVPAVPARRVARAILQGIRRRSPVVTAVPWQTLGVIALELLAASIDGVLAKMPATPSDDAATQARPAPAPQPEPAAAAPAETPKALADPFEAALEPVARRMERVKLSPTFVRGALNASGDLELNELAMRWAGMPNKNERAALHEVLDALTSAGYLQSTGDETWKVLRTAG